MQTEKALRRALLKQGYPSWGDLLTLLGVFIVATVLGSIIVGILQKIGSVSPGVRHFSRVFDPVLADDRFRAVPT